MIHGSYHQTFATHRRIRSNELLRSSLSSCWDSYCANTEPFKCWSSFFLWKNFSPSQCLSSNSQAWHVSLHHNVVQAVEKGVLTGATPILPPFCRESLFEISLIQSLFLRNCVGDDEVGATVALNSVEVGVEVSEAFDQRESIAMFSHFSTNYQPAVLSFRCLRRWCQ